MSDFLDGVLDAGGSKSVSDDVLHAGSQEESFNTAKANLSLAGDQTKSVESATLGDHYGINPRAVENDLDYYKKLHADQTATAIVGNNPKLQAYINSHPMAAGISKDDLPRLDDLTKVAGQFKKQGLFGVGTLGLTPFGLSGLTPAIRGFEEGFGQGGLGSWLDLKDIQQDRLGATGWSLLGAPLEFSARLGSGLITAATREGQFIATSLGMKPEKAQDLADRTIQAAGDPGLWASLGPLEEIGLPFMAAAHNAALREATKIRPYVESGRPPPPGVSLPIDIARIQQADHDAEILDGMLKAAAKTETRDVAPDMLRKLLDQFDNLDGNIGIKASAVRELYGEEPIPALPHDDGALGWIPNLDEKLATAEETGGDVQVPLKDWLTHVDPSIAKQLADHTRARPDGFTPEEAKAMVEAYHGSPHEFEAFDIGKVGTGEGAQAYGYGHYVAQNEAVAKEYAVGRQTGGAASLGSFAGQEVSGMDVKPPSMYRVRIKREPEEFLDHDTKLSEQPNIFKAISGIPEIEKLKGTSHEITPDLTGQQVVRNLNEAYGDEQASRMLGESGIAGIKYLDQGSRGATKEQIQTHIDNLKEKIARLNTVEGAQEFEKYSKIDVIKGRSQLEDAIAAQERNLQSAPEKQTRNFVVFRDQDLEITHRNDIEVVRKAAGLERAMEEPPPEAAPARGYTYTTPGGNQLRIVPTEEMTAAERDIASLAVQTAQRILGTEPLVAPTDQITLKSGRQVGGLSVVPEGLPPVIAYIIGKNNVPKVVRHEAIHQLINWGLITPEEWAAVKEAALTKNAEGKDWLDKHHIRERYAKSNLDENGLIEEAFAEEYGEWGALHERAADQIAEYAKIQGVFEKIYNFFADLHARLEQYFGHPPQIKDLFERIESGEVKDRPRGEELPAAAKATELPSAKQLELPGITRMEQRMPFAGAAPGLTKAQTERFQRLLAKRIESDRKYLLELEQAKAQKLASKAFKERKNELRPKVADEINARPDMVLNEKLQEGAVKINPDSLTPAQIEALPKEWLAKDGMNAHDLAASLGAGDGLIEQVAGIRKLLDTSKMRYIDFRRRLVDAEVERRAADEVRGPSIQEIYDHVLSETQEDMLHEEVYRLATEAGQEFPIKPAALKDEVINTVRNDPFKEATREKYLTDAGRIAREMEVGAVKDDPFEVFRQGRRHYMSIMKARYAKQVERAGDVVEKLADKYSKREVKGVDADYVRAVHAILQKIGLPTGRTAEDLAKSMSAMGVKDLRSFIEEKEKEFAVMGLEFPVADFLLEDSVKNIDSFTAGDMQGLAQSLKTLDYRGRREKQVFVQGAAENLADLIGRMREQLEAKFPSGAKPLEDKSLVTRFVREVVAGSHAIETVLRRFDGRDPNGVFTQTITYPAAKALNDENVIQRELSQRYRDLGKVEKPNQIVEHDFVDPVFGGKRKITRAMLDNIIANIGNKYNRERMAYTLGLVSLDEKGRMVFDTDSLMKWIESVSTKEDLDRSQKRGDTIWKWLKDKDDNVYRNIYGEAPEEIPLDGFMMHGKVYEGWYHPIIQDSERAVRAGQRTPDPITKPTSFWPSTPNSWTKRRTGAIERLDIEPGMAEIKMSQMVHDIALREYVDDVSKLILNDRFRLAVTANYGREYYDLLHTWLYSVAGNRSYNEGALKTGTRFSNFMRQNVISTYIAFNIAGTVFKHAPTAAIMSMKEVAPAKFLMNSFNTYLSGIANKAGYGQNFMNFLGKDPALGNSIWEFVNKYSEEIQRRDRNYMETMSGVHNIVYGKPNLRNKIMQWGAKAVAVSDMLSAVPLWYTKYQEVMGKVGDHARAVEQADEAVRNAHGSTSAVSRPLIADNNSALAPWFTSLYGFFGANMQRKIELLHDINDTYKLGKSGEIKQAANMLPQIMTSTLAYVIAPAVVEEVVTSQFTDDRRGPLAKALGFTLLALSNSIVGLRDFDWALEHGSEPSAGLLSGLLHDLSAVPRDLGKHRPFSKQNAGKLVEDTLTMVGDITGAVPKAAARVARIAIDKVNRQQNPRTAGDWWRGATSGRAQRRIER